MTDRSALHPHPPGSKQLGRLAARRSGPGTATGRNHPTALGDDAPPKVRAVQVHAPDGLIDGTKLGDREGRPDERRGDARELQVGTHPPDGIADDPSVVESEPDAAIENIRHRNPGGSSGISARDYRAYFTEHR